MKVYIPNATNLSSAMKRVEAAMWQHLPSDLTSVDSVEEADIVIFHVIGYPETVAAVAALRSNQRYVLVQYCLRSTQKPNTASWQSLWQNALLVWSYYALPALQAEDDAVFDFPFYFAPLGADSEIFKPLAVRRRTKYAMLTSGYVAESEGCREAAEACRRVNRAMFHLGPDLNLGSHVVSINGITDRTLAEVYQSCDYVAGLRRCEGFELPAAEGLLCCVRPICFDAPHYRDWYQDSAYYIKEEAPEQVSASIEAIIRNEPTLFTGQELADLRDRFSWERIIKNFWKRVTS